MAGVDLLLPDRAETGGNSGLCGVCGAGFAGKWQGGAKIRTNYVWLTAWLAWGYIATYAKSAFENPIPEHQSNQDNACDRHLFLRGWLTGDTVAGLPNFIALG